MFETGNTLARKRRKFEQAIDRALAADDGLRLRACAEKVLELSAAGERWAVELLRDTLDGRPASNIIATDEEGRSLAIAIITYNPHVTTHADDTVQLPAAPLPAPSIKGPGQRH